MFNTLHTVCFMHGLSIYEIKRICHRAYFFRISSLVHMHNIHPGANIHPGCKFAPGVYFGHVNGVL